MRKACLNAVYELAKKNERIVFIGSDLGFGVLEEFKRDMPDRFFMEGISEANVIGMATGLAMEGKIVYVNTIAPFLTRRCFEHILIDLCHHNVNVRFIGNGGGLVYAPLGPTHLAFEDIAAMRCIPNMTIVAPSDAEEMNRFMPLTVDYKGPVYIRLAKGYDPIVSSDTHGFEIGKAIPVKKGQDALVVTTGITLKLAMEASDILAREGIDISILHMHTVKPLDREALLSMASTVRAVVSIEEHSILGGLGGAVAEILAESDLNTPLRFRRIGLPDVFPDDYGSQASLMEKYAITTENLITTIKQLLTR